MVSTERHDDTASDERRRKGLKYSIIDGTFHASMLGFGESFFVPLAVFLKATNLQIGLLTALPQATGSFLQLFSNAFMRLFGTRKRLVATSALLQALMHVPIALVFFMGELKVYLLIFFACFYWVFGMILGPAWNSWMGDITLERERGEYFGRRNKITGFSTFLCYLVAGYILQRFGGGTAVQYIGFAAIFTLALASRLLSFYFLTRIHEPPYEPKEEASFTFVEFLREAWGRNYGIFVLYLSFMTFCVSISGPFFTPYMLKDLGMDYVTYTTVIATALTTKLLFMPVWGRACDRYGARKVLSLTGFMMPLCPLLWLFSTDTLYLMAIQVYAGFIWSGFDISAFNFVFDTTSPSKRATCVAYFNVMNGAAILSGALLGSLIVRYNTLLESKYYLVFITSFALRYVASSVFIPKIRERREVEEIPYPHLFFKIISAMPITGLALQLIPFLKKRNGRGGAE